MNAHTFQQGQKRQEIRPSWVGVGPLPLGETIFGGKCDKSLNSSSAKIHRTRRPHMPTRGLTFLFLRQRFTSCVSFLSNYREPTIVEGIDEHLREAHNGRGAHEMLMQHHPHEAQRKLKHTYEPRVSPSVP